MQIQSGKLYENRTWKYLYPCLKHYDSELIKRLSSFFKLCVGVGDQNKEDLSISLYILIDTNIALSSEQARVDYKIRFGEFLTWLKHQDYYVDDYMYENGVVSTKHMVVITLPKEFHNAYFNFIKGNYSNMYTPKAINDYFAYVKLTNKETELIRNAKIKNTRDVLTKDKKYLPKFVAQVNERFATNVEDKYFLDAELDYPPVEEEEIFNYKKIEVQGDLVSP